jgi:alpha-mannosidase
MKQNYITRIALLLTAAAFFSTPLRAQTPPRLYIANDDHTDYYWSGTETEYRQWFIDMLDYYVAQAERTRNDPPDVQGRFNADGNYWLWTYEKHKQRADFERLIETVRSGHVTIPLQTLVMLYGGMPMEAVLRSMYYAGRIERRYGLTFDLACAMENQTLPYGLASLWAGSGARYSWRGVCACATKMNMNVERPREIYYATGPDGRSVLMKWNSLFNNQSVGGYAEARNPRDAVDVMTTSGAYLARWPWSARALFGKGWDDHETLTDEFITTARALSDSTRRVIVSNESDFFKDFEATAPREAPIPSFAGSFGNEWDLYVSSMAEVNASVKRAVEELRCAEALATVVSLRDPGFMAPYAAAGDSAFVNLGLFYEHNWTMDGSASGERPAFQRRTVRQIQQYVSVLKRDALQRLAGSIPSAPGATRFVVFNPLGWKRTDIVDFNVFPAESMRVFDLAEEREVRSQIVQRNGRSFLRILAEEVPSVGYRVYEFRPGQTQYTDSAARMPDYDSIETVHYRVYATLGEIRSLVDKSHGGKEWTRRIGWSGFLNRQEGSGGLGDGGIDLQCGPVSAINYSDMGTNFGGAAHTVRISMHRGIDRIDIENETESYPSDLITRRFVFDMPRFTVRHEEVGAIATAKRIRDGGNYSNELARTDWLTMNHFVDISDDTSGVTISNADSPFFRVGNSTVDSLDTSTPIIDAVVAARFDNLGARNQDGEATFTNRYALRTHGAYNQAEAMRFALEHQNPLVAAQVTGAPGLAPVFSWSLLGVADSNCLLWALKPSEEGIASGGVIARVWNLADAPSNLALTTTDRRIESAAEVTHIETDIAPAASDGHSLTDRLEKQMIKTYRLRVSTTPSGIIPAGQPASILLEPNHPNPFTDATTIRLTRSGGGRDAAFSLDIRDLLGRRVMDLTEQAGSGGAITIPRSAFPAAGVYVCRLVTDAGIQTRLLVAR